MAAEGLGVGLSAFSTAFNAAQDSNPEYKMRQRAEAQLAFDTSPLGKQLAAHDLQKVAAGEAARLERGRIREIDGAISYFDNPEEQEATRTYLDTLDLSSITRFRADTVDNKDFTGLININPDEIDIETYEPFTQGDLKQLGTSNYYYHSAKSRKGKTASATNEYTRITHMLGRAYKEENKVDIIPDKEKAKLQKRAFESLTSNQQVLFKTQSTSFNTAIDATIRKYKGSLIVTDKAFRTQLANYGAELDVALISGTDQEKRVAKRKVEALQAKHKQQQQTGYGYSESQYRSELRGLLSRSVGALGLSDAKQIENFMTQFLEDERNQGRLLNRLISKYGMPKTDIGAAGAGSVTTGSNARIKKISEAKVNTRLGR
tara:strand:- start:819 stop:1943 length:1125 start_codon:yes stop_codon:yes gene_type:complete